MRPETSAAENRRPGFRRFVKTCAAFRLLSLGTKLKIFEITNIYIFNNTIILFLYTKVFGFISLVT